MADLLIGYLQDIALHVLAHAGGSSGKDASSPHERSEVQEALPPPMFENNWETHASHCRMDDDFKALVSDAKVGPVSELHAHVCDSEALAC